MMGYAFKMKNDISEHIAGSSISEPKKRGLQETKAFYTNILLPDGWDDTIDPEEYFYSHEEIRSHLNLYKGKQIRRENIAGYIICLLVLLIFTGVHLSGIHKWAIAEKIFPRSKPKTSDLSEKPDCLSLNGVPDYFRRDVKAINNAIKNEKWGETEKLLENIIHSQEIKNEPDFYEEILYRVVKTHNLTKKYHLAWSSFLEIKGIYNKKNSIVPYHVIYAAAQARYEIAANGSYGNGMAVEDAKLLMIILNQIRADYSEKADKDKRILLFEADSLLSSLGKDNEKFDIEDQKNIAVWEQFEITLDKLLKHETESRAAIFLQYRKWLKIKSFCYIPIYNEERVIIGKYSYDESYAEKMTESLLNQMKN